MSRKLFLIVTLSLVSFGSLGLPLTAKAETPLTRATVQALRNQVQLIFKNRVTRAARNADTMTPGDSLATARQSFAELRFNDRSLARIGERTLFQFVPNTRNFYLGNGTALLLIPPGQGRTNVRTPNAAAGIRGSALFVRYNEDTNTTIVGALTNSHIEVSNGETSHAQTLQAGQMAVIVQNQIVQIYNFDLGTFYQTSELVKDLDLPFRSTTPNADPGIAAVQAETSQAVREQPPLTGQISENPAFVSLTPLNVQTAVTPNLLGTTPIPSGWDLGTASQTIQPTASQPTSPDLQSVPPSPRPLVPGGPTLPNPTTSAAPSTPTLNPGTSGQPITGTPTSPRPAPTVVTPALTVVTPTPPSVPAPAPAPAPTVVTPAPTVVTPAPTVVTPTPPSVPAPAPAPAPTVVTPAPTVVTPAPTVVTPTPPSVPVPAPAPAPTVVTPAPTVVTPAPTVVTPAPTVVTPTPPSVPVPAPAPAPTVVTPAPTVVTPAPTTSAAPRPAPTVLTPTPSVQTTPVNPTAVSVPTVLPTATQ